MKKKGPYHSWCKSYGPWSKWSHKKKTFSEIFNFMFIVSPWATSQWGSFTHAIWKYTIWGVQNRLFAILKCSELWVMAPESAIFSTLELVLEKIECINNTPLAG